jgi:hypothetical protein
MPDFEDSNCPTWDNMVQGQVRLADEGQGLDADWEAALWLWEVALQSSLPAACVRLLPQINLRDAVRGTVSFRDPRSGKQYALREVRRCCCNGGSTVHCALLRFAALCWVESGCSRAVRHSTAVMACWC